MLSASVGASLGAVVLCSTALAGGPTGGTVVSGQASITSSAAANKTLIKQSSNAALINWNNFSVSSGWSVIFEQPNASSLTVNRVTGTQTSVIDGALLANGRVWIINGNGILFGPGSEINVGGLLATTSDLSDQDYLDGKYKFSPSANPNASVVNEGTIVAAKGGTIVLSAPTVDNQGVVSADLGTVVLGGARSFTLDMNGDNLLVYQVDVPASAVQGNTNGASGAASVTNSGTISAAGGRILLTARAAQDVQESVINNTGIIEATSVSSHDGDIDLDAGPDGTVNVGGRVDASGMNGTEQGGQVAITGNTVNVNNGAVINASGETGGGTILIGGGFHGKGSIANASTTNVGTAAITADAETSGNGGNIAIWSNNNTTFNGTISAKGGANGGNGGYVETSGGALQVGLSAQVNTTAAHGTMGTWLLDPDNIIIETGGTTPLTSGTLALTTDADLTDTVDPSTIITALQSTNVELEAYDAITVLSPVVYSSANSLYMLAGGNINIYANVENTLATGGGSINLIAGWDETTLPPNSLTAAGVYGNSSGSINVGTTNADGDAIVGSMSGSTLLAGANVTVESDSGIAQVGYAGNGTGDITVAATGDVVVDALNGEYAQIGNGGYNVTGAIGGNITVQAGGSLTVEDVVNCGDCDQAGVAAIGNVGGLNSTESGDINVNVTGALDVTASGVASFAQIGNQATASPSGSATGNITITSGPLAILADNATYSYAMIGNGGQINGFDNGDGTSGAISVTATSLSITSNAAASPYAAQARISNLGTGDVSGDITVNTTGDIVLSANDGNLATIGLGEGCTQPCSGTTAGAISVTSGGLITIEALGGGEARIGSDTVTPASTVDVTAAGDILISLSGTNNSGYQPGAWIGSQNNFSDNGGDVTVTSTNGDIDLESGEANGLVNIGPQGTYTSGTTSGNVVVSATDPTNGNIILNASGLDAIALIGPSNQGFVTTGNTTVTVGNTLSLTTGSYIGELLFPGSPAGSTTTGNVSITTKTWTGDILDSLSNDIAYGNVTFDITGTQAVVIPANLDYSSPYNASLTNGGDITFEGSFENSSTGNITITSPGTVTIGGANARGNASVGSFGGTTSISTGTLVLAADNGHAQVGYFGGGSGNIDIITTADVSLDGGAQSGYFAQIGNGGYLSNGSNAGNISITSSGDTDLSAGSGSFAYAQIGNGGAQSNESSNGYSNTGTITVLAADVMLDSGSGTASYSQIGNGGFEAGAGFLTGVATNSGAINVTAVDNVALQGGSSTDTYAQIGNGGDQINANAAQSTSGVLSGNITVLAQTGGVSLTAGTGTHSYVQIGNGGYAENAPDAMPANFTTSGSVTVSDLVLTGGSGGPDSYAQIGNGDDASSGIADVSGEILVDHGAGLTLENGTAADSLAFIGNATGIGTVSGTAPGALTPPDVSTSVNSDQSAQESETENTNLVQSIDAVDDAPPEVLTASNIANYPLAAEAMSLNVDPYPEGQDVSDQLLANIGDSLDPDSKSSAPAEVIDLIPGLLKEVIGPEPDAIPPPDKSYSSWGNGRLWQ
jgi:filamentous hemagglutinin family protein